QNDQLASILIKSGIDVDATADDLTSALQNEKSHHSAHAYVARYPHIIQPIHLAMSVAKNFQNLPDEILNSTSNANLDLDFNSDKAKMNVSGLNYDYGKLNALQIMVATGINNKN